MPADNSLTQEPSALHSDGNKPYQCSTAPKPPGGDGFIDYGYCRTSLDLHATHHGSADPRCPANCPHKAPIATAQLFGAMFYHNGALMAAKFSRRARNESAVS